MNIDKTIAKPLGPYTPQDTCGLDWTHVNITTLGVVISGNESHHHILNYKELLKNICWNHRFVETTDISAERYSDCYKLVGTAQNYIFNQCYSYAKQRL